MNICLEKITDALKPFLLRDVIIKTDKKEIIIAKPAVTEMKAKDNSIFQTSSQKMRAEISCRMMSSFCRHL